MSIYSNEKFCVYITMYSGNKLPPFYIGSSSIERILNGYHGSVSSKKYKDVFDKELIENPHLFKTKIVKKYYSRKMALLKEKILQKKLNVVRSSMYYNESIATINGMFGRDTSGKLSPRYIDAMFKWERISTGEVIEMSRYHFVRAYGIRESAASMLINGNLYESCGWKIYGTIKPLDVRPNMSRTVTGKGNPRYDEQIYIWQNNKTGTVEEMTGLAFREKYPEVSPSDVSDLKKAYNAKTKMSRKKWVIMDVLNNSSYS